MYYIDLPSVIVHFLFGFSIIALFVLSVLYFKKKPDITNNASVTAGTEAPASKKTVHSGSGTADMSTLSQK